LFSLFVALAALTVPCWVSAFEGELQLGADLSYVHEFQTETNNPGGRVALRGAYAVTDYLAVTAYTSWSGLAARDAAAESQGPLELRQHLTATAGVIYALDVLRIVPFMGLGLGVGAIHQDQWSASFLISALAGFDWKWTHDWSTGFEVAYELLLGTDLIPARLCFSLRASWHHLL
jgi:hypothetical protein